MALIVEVIQYFVGRTADIDDVQLRVLRCMLAYTVYRIVYAIGKRMLSGQSSTVPVI